MDIRHYFEPVNFEQFLQQGRIKFKNTLGAQIAKTTHSFSPEKSGEIDIALFGVPADSRIENSNSTAPDRIRSELYGLAEPENQIKIADFGNLKTAGSSKGILKALRDLTEIFTELGIVTIVIGGSQDLTVGICEAFCDKPFFTLSAIDALLDEKIGKEPLTRNNYLTRVFQTSNLFQFNLIGYQSYLVAPEVLLKTALVNQHMRLGKLREDITCAEPVFRNSDVVSMDVTAVKYGDAPGNPEGFPNGLRAEEACQIARYAGAAGKVKVFGLFNAIPDATFHPVSDRLYAQIIWYFIDGVTYRTGEIPQNDNNHILYQVEVNNVDQPLVFIKHKPTNHWWMRLQLSGGKYLYFACSEEEYRQAAANEIPTLWLQLIQKTDKFLK
ncbi:MAG: hypothetical protein CSA36_08005 [Draconibacterium sp.]|nr:MAG: hypothetical protein CSA36_08005 [Draconibacterium sp.]